MEEKTKFFSRRVCAVSDFGRQSSHRWCLCWMLLVRALDGLASATTAAAGAAANALVWPIGP